MSEPFDAAAWHAAMRDAGQEVRAVELIEHTLDLVVLGRSYDNARDAARWAALTDHRDAVIAFLTERQRKEEAA